MSKNNKRKTKKKTKRIKKSFGGNPNKMSKKKVLSNRTCKAPGKEFDLLLQEEIDQYGLQPLADSLIYYLYNSNNPEDLLNNLLQQPYIFYELISENLKNKGYKISHELLEKLLEKILEFRDNGILKLPPKIQTLLIDSYNGEIPDTHMDQMAIKDIGGVSNQLGGSPTPETWGWILGFLFCLYLVVYTIDGIIRTQILGQQLYSDNDIIRKVLAPESQTPTFCSYFGHYSIGNSLHLYNMLEHLKEIERHRQDQRSSNQPCCHQKYTLDNWVVMVLDEAERRSILVDVLLWFIGQPGERSDNSFKQTMVRFIDNSGENYWFDFFLSADRIKTYKDLDSWLNVLDSNIPGRRLLHSITGNCKGQVNEWWNEYVYDMARKLKTYYGDFGFKELNYLWKFLHSGNSRIEHEAALRSHLVQSEEAMEEGTRLSDPRAGRLPV